MVSGKCLGKDSGKGSDNTLTKVLDKGLGMPWGGFA